MTAWDSQILYFGAPFPFAFSYRDQGGKLLIFGLLDHPRRVFCVQCGTVVGPPDETLKERAITLLDNPYEIVFLFCSQAHRDLWYDSHDATAVFDEAVRWFEMQMSERRL